MSDVLRAAVLGIVEGLTEFLPVSSTGHLILVQPLLGIDADIPPWKTFLYFIQIGAILAVVFYFGRGLVRQVFHPVRKGWRTHLITKLVVATIPAAAIGLPLNNWIESHLETPWVVAIALIVGAGLMELIERRFRRTGGGDPESITLRQSFLIGVAQCVSIIPGTSRAMATIMGGLLVGLPIGLATEFSFYLAIPTLLGAGTLKVIKHRHELHANEAVVLGVGFVTAFIVALLVVEGFMRYVQTRRLRPFAIYRVALGAAVLAWWYATGRAA